MKITRKFKWALPLALLMALFFASVALAITIVVDGVKESDWDLSPGPGSQSDDNEDDIDNRYDIIEVKWTNDSTGGTAPYGNLYFLVETVDNFDSTYPPLDSSILICIDTDNAPGTGATVDGFCNNMAGVDRYITANVTLSTVIVRRWTGTNWAIVTSPLGGMRTVAYHDEASDGVADLPYIEIGVDLQSLGINSTATCRSTMPSAVYYDNGMGDIEDTVPNEGTFNIGCGEPTAITLTQLEAQSNTPAWIAAAGLGLLALAGGAALIFKRRQA